MALAREVEDRWPLALCLIRLGQAVSAADVAAGRRMCEQGVAVARSVGDKNVLSLGLEELAPLYWWEGNLAAAGSVAEEALVEGRAIGSVAEVLVAVFFLVCTSCLRGDLAKAREYGVQGLAYCRETGASQWLFFVGPLAYGLMACFGGDAERGVRLIAAGEAFLRQLGIDLSKMGPGLAMVVGHALEKARALLGSAFELAWAEGQQMTLEHALALATEHDSVEAPLPTVGRGPDID